MDMIGTDLDESALKICPGHRGHRSQPLNSDLICGAVEPAVDAEKLARARSMVAKGLTVREAAIRLKVGKTALYEALRLAAGENITPLLPKSEGGG